MRNLFAVIASGDSFSGIVDARRINGLEGIFAPALAASGDLLIQGAMFTGSGTTPVSADFCRFQNTSVLGSGDLRFAVGSANHFLPMPNGFLPTPSYIRLEAGVAQTDTRTFTLLTR